jgi:hypothetical protein
MITEADKLQELQIIRKMIHAYIITTLTAEQYAKFEDTFNSIKTVVPSQLEELFPESS